jgi:hypothetical protein
MKLLSVVNKMVITKKKRLHNQWRFSQIKIHTMHIVLLSFHSFNFQSIIFMKIMVQ